MYIFRFWGPFGVNSCMYRKRRSISWLCHLYFAQKKGKYTVSSSNRIKVSLHFTVSLQKVRLKLMCISQFSHGNMLHHPLTKTYWDSRSKSILHGLGELCISISSLRAFSIVFNICYYRLICTPSVCLKACSPFYLAIMYFVYLGTWIRCNLQYTICRATFNLPGSS